jgi:hypothetical protein
VGRQLVKDPAAKTVARYVHNEMRRMLMILTLKEPVAPALTAAPPNAGGAFPGSATVLFPLTEPLWLNLPAPTCLN